LCRRGRSSPSPASKFRAMVMPPLFLWLDPYLIWFFRLTDRAALNIFLGTAVMASLALLLGKLGAALVLAAGRRYALRLSNEAKQYQDLSHQALQAGDRPAYEAANELANEAFSKSFFLGVAQSAAFFWPVGLVLAWMQYRFLDVEMLHLPRTNLSIGFVGVFILVYIMILLLIKLAKKQICHLFGLNNRGRSFLSTPDLPKAG
jgi:hypothetical protein